MRAQLLVLTGVLLAAAAPPPAPQAEPSPEEAKFFETKVRPLLSARCFKCHGAEAAKPKGGLRLDSREGVLKGGNSGAVIVPGKPAQSLLLTAVSGRDPDLKMPPKEDLPREEIETLARWIAMGAPFPAGKAAATRREKEITDKDRAFWSFRPVLEPPVPAAGGAGPVDAFLLQKLAAEGLSPAPEADRRTLIRRATFDLHGLPPAPEEVEAFVGDPSPDAYAKLIDRLLASPRYGERWARHWLDLVRYAESDGFRQDAYRPHVWPYRDYVIRSFNEDKPYDRFVLEQLAGDELAPDDPEVVVATGFLRLGMYEYNQRDVPKQWGEILNDLTDVTGDVFLAMGMGCARCHDHKFDPLLQRDYFALQAFFAPLLWRDDAVLATRGRQEERRKALANWEEKTAALRAEIAAIERPHVASAEKSITTKFLPEFQAMMRKPVADRTPKEHQIASLAHRQVVFERTTIDGKIKGAEREKWSALKRQLAEFDALRPAELPPAFIATDVGPVAPPTTIPGDPENRPVGPAFLSVLGGGAPPAAGSSASTGRRTALAQWLVRPDHPLTARVIVNRIWQHHFGRGLVASSSDFGTLGEKPSHPELLDWLAARFVKDGWSFKKMHRLLMTSAAYRQSATRAMPQIARLKDPENRWLWRMNPRRLEAEEIRDAMLAATGELDGRAGGESADPAGPRRTVYTKAIRNTRDPLLDVFDLPESFASVGGRNVTTTATQALLMINGRWPLDRAQAFAARLRKSGARDDAERVDLAWRLAYGRPPSEAEQAAALAFLGRGGPARAVAALPPPLVQTMPHRGGQAAKFRNGALEDQLRLPEGAALPPGDFTIEAVVQLESLYENAAVRVIASQWDGEPTHAGWSFGVTSEKSKHQPRNLILQLAGDGGYEVVASDLRLELHKTQYVAVSVRIAEKGESGITFYMWDLTDNEAQLRTASVKHRVTGGLRSAAALVVGGRDGAPGHGWDGLIDEVRLTAAAITRDRLLVLNEARPIEAAADWKFEEEPGFTKDSTGRQPDLLRRGGSAGAAASDASLVDLCHVLLNSNEFLYVD